MKYVIMKHCIGGVIVSVFTSIEVDGMPEPWSMQTKRL